MRIANTLAAGLAPRGDVVVTALRDPAQLKGRCGRCEHKVICGGQRGRAYAITGDYLETDPACVYEPPLN